MDFENVVGNGFIRSAVDDKRTQNLLTHVSLIPLPQAEGVDCGDFPQDGVGVKTNGNRYTKITIVGAGLVSARFATDFSELLIR
jgi:hypothetical protein